MPGTIMSAMNTLTKPPRRWFRRKRVLAPFALVTLLLAAVWLTRPEPLPFRGGGPSARLALHARHALPVRWFAGAMLPNDRRFGADVSSVVVAVDSAVTQFKVGDEVDHSVADGAFAEYARASQTFIAHEPANISFEQAAAVPVAGLTALQGLRDHSQLKPGQRC